MHWSQQDYEEHKGNSMSSHSKDDKNTGTNVSDESSKTDPIYMNLAKKSYECFIRGIAIFEEVKDNANLTILLCNMGRFMRFRAHLENDKEFSFKKICYENAFSSYERALTILESKKRNSQLWDLVTWVCTNCICI